MKTLKNLLLVLGVGAFLASCSNVPNTGSIELKTKLDSVSYALGFFGAQQTKKQFKQSPFKLDSADYKEMAKIFATADMNESFVKMIENQFDTLDRKVYTRAFLNELAYGKSYFNEMTADTYLRKVYNEIREEKNAKSKEIADANLKKGQEFLAENKNKPGIKVTDSGLQYEIIKEGKGKIPGPKDKVKCNYKGTLIDGTVFDSSYDRGKPAVFPVNGVIKGWVEALQMMPVGSKWKLYIPAELAYGQRGSQPNIGPNEALIFEIELLDIETPEKK